MGWLPYEVRAGGEGKEVSGVEAKTGGSKIPQVNPRATPTGVTQLVGLEGAGEKRKCCRSPYTVGECRYRRISWWRGRSPGRSVGGCMVKEERNFG